MEVLDKIILDKNGGVSLQLRSCAAVLVQKELSYDEAAEVHFAAERSLSIPLCCYISGIPPWIGGDTFEYVRGFADIAGFAPVYGNSAYCL